jgi:hypothetical protein
MVEQFRGTVLDRAVSLFSNAEAEFVAASQAAQEAIYFRALLRFNFRQVAPSDKSAPQKYRKIMPLVL